jgi:hypothetical protein
MAGTLLPIIFVAGSALPLAATHESVLRAEASRNRRALVELKSGERTTLLLFGFPMLLSGDQRAMG